MEQALGLPVVLHGGDVLKDQLILKVFLLNVTGGSLRIRKRSIQN